MTKCKGGWVILRPDSDREKGWLFAKNLLARLKDNHEYVVGFFSNDDIHWPASQSQMEAMIPSSLLYRGVPEGKLDDIVESLGSLSTEESEKGTVILSEDAPWSSIEPMCDIVKTTNTLGVHLSSDVTLPSTLEKGYGTIICAVYFDDDDIRKRVWSSFASWMEWEMFEKTWLSTGFILIDQRKEKAVGIKPREKKVVLGGEITRTFSQRFEK